jgi:hypothetical protein
MDPVKEFNTGGGKEIRLELPARSITALTGKKLRYGDRAVKQR